MQFRTMLPRQCQENTSLHKYVLDITHIKSNDSKIIKPAGIDSSFQLGNIEALARELDLYKNTCLELDHKVADIMSTLENEKKNTQNKIEMLNNELKKSVCKDCSKSKSDPSALNENNSFDIEKTSDFSFMGAVKEHQTTFSRDDKFEAVHNVLSSTMIIEKPLDSVLHEVSANQSFKNSSHHLDDSPALHAVVTVKFNLIINQDPQFQKTAESLSRPA